MNLDEDPVSFRGVLSQLMVAEMLSDVIDPKTIEVEPDIAGGDVDIAIQRKPPVYLQVKSSDLFEINKGGQKSELLGAIDAARDTVLADVRQLPVSTYTHLRIHADRAGELLMSGKPAVVNRLPPAHIIVLEPDAALCNTKTNAVIEKQIKKALGQLKEHKGAVLAPVVSLLQYPHNQAEAVRHVRKLFRENPRWTLAGGVVLVTTGYAEAPQGGTGLTVSEPRLIPIPNPNAPEELRVNEGIFNTDVGDETLFDEWPTFPYIERLDPAPPTELVQIRADGFYIDGVRFGPLSSSPPGAPFALTGVRGSLKGLPPTLRLCGEGETE